MRIKYLTNEQTTALLDVIKDIRHKLIIRLLIDTGMRVGEFTRMSVAHLDVEKSYIRIPAEHSKTKSARTVRVNTQLMNDLVAYLKMMKIKQGYIWKSRQRKGKPVTVRSIQYMIKGYAKKAKLDWVTPHKLRHTHVVRALEAGVPINAVQAQVGHKRLTTTQIYAALAPKQVKDAYEKVGL